MSRVCNQFQTGTCKFGQNCKFLHLVIQEKFQKDKKFFHVGIVGFSREQYDEKEAKSVLEMLIDKICDKKDPKTVKIVSGGTNQGIPKLAYRYATSKGYKTIAVTAERGLNVKSGLYPVDELYIIGKSFGDESEEFVKNIDVLIRVGGGKQSRNEIELFKKYNKSNSNLLEQEIKWFE